MKKILLVILCGVLFLPLSAQDTDKEPATYGPKAGNMQVSLLLGKGMFYANIEDVLLISRNAPVVGTWPGTPANLTSELPFYLTLSDPNANSIANMIGVEFKYFVTDNISVSLSGAGYVNNTPWRETVDPIVVNGVTVLPKYVNIDAQLKTRVVANLGAQYYFNVGNNRIHPYAGILGTFQYASISAQSTYSGIEPFELEEDRRDAGMRTGQIIGWAPAVSAGIEYSVLPGLTIGFEIKPVSMYYSGIQLFAQPGLDAMTGENIDWTFFSQPQFKIGFRF